MRLQAEFIAYFVFAVACAAYLSIRNSNRRRVLAFLIAFWILGGSIIQQDFFSIPIEVLGGKLQIKRIIFLFLLLYLIFFSLVRTRNGTRRISLTYEPLFYVFIFWSLVVFIYHLLDGGLKLKEFVRLTEGTLMVFVVYLCLRRWADESLIKVFTRALIVVGVISSIVAILQFFVNPDILRTGSDRIAFGGKLRSNGVFDAEYMNSYILIGAGFLTLVSTAWSNRVKAVLLPLFTIGIVLSFHRMSWFVAFLLLIIYLVYEHKGKMWKFLLGASFVLFIFFVVTTELFPILQQFEETSLYRSRINQNTMTNRLRYYEMVLNNYDKIAVWGAGSMKSSLYYYGMIDIEGRQWAKGEVGGIHNLYLETLFLYGTPLLCLLTAFLTTVLLSFKKYYRKFGPFFLFQFAFTFMFCTMNLSNSFPFNSEFPVFFGMVLGLGAAGANIYMNSSTPSSLHLV